MRVGWIVGGIVLLVIALIVFGIGVAMVDDADSVIAEYETGAGGVVRFLSAEHEKNYRDAVQQRDTGYAMQGFGMLIGIIGFIIFIVGFLIENPKDKRYKAQANHHTDRPRQSVHHHHYHRDDRRPPPRYRSDRSPRDDRPPHRQDEFRTSSRLDPESRYEGYRDEPRRSRSEDDYYEPEKTTIERDNKTDRQTLSKNDKLNLLDERLIRGDISEATYNRLREKIDR